MPDFTLHPRPVFRATAADQRHAATLAEHLRATGARATPTTVIRSALAMAAATVPEQHGERAASSRQHPRSV